MYKVLKIFVRFFGQSLYCILFKVVLITYKKYSEELDLIFSV